MDKTIMATARFHFQAHQGLPGYRQIADDWRQLAHSLGDACAFYHEPEWTLAFLESGACDPDTVWLVTACSGDALVAVVPLQYQDYRIGPFTPRLLGTIEDDQLQLCDFVFHQKPENAGFMEALVQWLKAGSGLRWDGLRLRRVRENSAICYAASQVLPSNTLVLQHAASSYFDTSSDFEHATRAMSYHFRRNVRRQLRRSEESWKVRAETASSGEALERAFGQFLKIEASGWKGREGLGSAIHCQPALLGFYQSLVRHFGARGECVINLLWYGDEAVAGEFALKTGRTLHVLKCGYSEEYAKYAPGNVLLQLMIQQACEDASTDVLSLVNDPPWAHRFKPLKTGVWSYFIPNTTLRGRLTLWGLLGKRAMDRRRQPPVSVGAEDEEEAETPKSAAKPAVAA